MTDSGAKPVAALLQVAVGVVFRADGAVLFGQRLAGKPYAGWWEFPGGKIEAGETVEQALARELDEELGMTVQRSLPWVVRDHLYPHAHVRLHFQRVTQWSGEPRSREGQAFVWQSPAAITVAPVLPAALPVHRWLALPARIRIAADTQPAAGGGTTARVTATPADDTAPGARPTSASASRQWQGALCRTVADIDRAASADLDLAVLPPGLDWPGFEAIVRQSKLPVFAQRADAAGARDHGAHGVVAGPAIQA